MSMMKMSKTERLTAHESHKQNTEIDIWITKKKKDTAVRGKANKNLKSIPMRGNHEPERREREESRFNLQP